MEIRRHDQIMKIIILNYEFPPLGGGAGNASANISKELARLGHRVTVVTTWFKDLPGKENVDGYTVIRLHSRRHKRDRSNVAEMFHYVLLAARECARILNDDPHDRLISFFALPTGLCAWYLKRKFNIPYILSLRGGDVPGFLPKSLWLYHALSLPLVRPVWKNAKYIVANSRGLKTLAERTARRLGRQVIMIPNGVDAQIFSPAEHSAGNDAEKDFPILFAGRLTEQKGATYLLKALAEIKHADRPAFRSIRCSVIGDGPLRAMLLHEARSLGIAEHVEFLGWVDRRSLPELYRRHAVFVLPSFEEGMPNVMLEAMASGLAVVATDIPGNNELIRNGVSGVLVKKTADLPQAILEIYHHRERIRKYGEAARQSAIKRGWAEIARQYANLF
ncbi:MAG: glycogen synthase [Candidatus Parcubacteria bacterium]|jgi:glycosyltransferase involved in cell wall biosynthesis|nr:glycogen synthase [Candidatus Parcubacteria bacterium]